MVANTGVITGIEPVSSNRMGVDTGVIFARPCRKMPENAAS